MSVPKKLNFITGNANKLAEVKAIIGNSLEIVNQAVDVPEIQGTSEEIAKEKSRRAAEAVSLYLRAFLLNQPVKVGFECSVFQTPHGS